MMSVTEPEREPPCSMPRYGRIPCRYTEPIHPTTLRCCIAGFGVQLYQVLNFAVKYISAMRRPTKNMNAKMPGSFHCRFLPNMCAPGAFLRPSDPISPDHLEFHLLHQPYVPPVLRPCASVYAQTVVAEVIIKRNGVRLISFLIKCYTRLIVWLYCRARGCRAYCRACRAYCRAYCRARTSRHLCRSGDQLMKGPSSATGITFAAQELSITQEDLLLPRYFSGSRSASSNLRAALRVR